MKNRKRFMALLLATVLVCSQVPSIGSSVTAEETELSTEVTESAQTSGGASEDDAEAAAAENVNTAASDDGADSSEAVASESTETEASEDTGMEAEAVTEAASEDAEEDTEGAADEDAEAAVAATYSMSLAGVDEDGGVSAVSEEEENGGEEDGSEGEDYEDWWIDAYWQNNTNQLLLDETVSTTLYLGHHYYYEEGEDGWWTDETLQASDFTYTLNYDTDAISVSAETAEDGYGVVLYATGKETGATQLTVQIYVDGILVVENYLNYYVTDSGYYYLEAKTRDGIVVPLGEDYDLSECDFTLYYNSTTNGPEKVSADDYYLVVEGWEDYCFESLNDMTLQNRIHTDGTYAYVVAYSNDDDEWLAGLDVWFDGLAYNTELNLTDEHLNEYGRYIVYGHDQGVELTQLVDDPYNLPDGYTVEWGVYEEYQELISVTGNGDSATVSVKTEDTDYDGWWVAVWADVYYEGNQISGCDIWMEVVIPYAEYYTPEDQTVALGEGLGYGNTIGCYVRSYEYPYGENTSVAFTDLSVDSQYEYIEDGVQESDAVISLDGDAESGWSIGTNTFGYANLIGTYLDIDGEEQTFGFTINVTDEYYYLDIVRPSNTDAITAGQEKEVTLNLVHVYTDEDNNAIWEDVDLSDYEVEITVENPDALTCDKTDDANTLVFTGLAADESSNTTIVIKDAEGNEIASNEIWWQVWGTLIDVLGEVDNVSLGESPDWSGLILSYTFVDGAGVTRTQRYSISNLTGGDLNSEFTIDSWTNYRITIGDYDSNAWTVEEGTEKDLVPTLIRTGSWSTDIQVVLQYYDEDDNCWYNLMDNWFNFAEWNYGIELNLTDEHLNEYGDYIVYGYEQTIELNVSDWSDELPDGYEVVWEINDESGLIRTVSSSNDSLTIEVAEADTDKDGWWSSVQAWVYKNGIEVCSNEVSFEILIPYTEYDEIEDFTVVLGNGWPIGPTIYYYGRGYENPYGFDGNAELTSLEIVSQYEYTDEGEQLTDDVISLDGEVGSGWNVNTNKCGYANMLATYVDADGKEQSFEFVIYVSGEYYSLNYDYVEGTDGRVQVNSTITIDTSLQYTYTTEEGYADEYTIEDYLDQGFLLNYDYYDDSIISVDDSGCVLSVTGLTEGGTDLYVYVTDEEGNLVADAWLWIEVTQDYYVLSYENDNVALGDTVDVAIGEDVTYTLTHYYTDDNGENHTEVIELTSENSYIELEGYDDGCWIRDDEDSLEFIRKGNWGTSIDVHVMLYDEDSEEFMEVASCGVWFDELNYNGSLTNDVDPDSWILYTGNEMTISYALEDDSVKIPDGAEYEWTVQGWDDEAGEWFDISEEDAVLSWTDNEDGTITVTSNSAEYGTAYVTMIVNYEGNQIIWADAWIDTRDERFDVEINVDPWVMLYNDTAVVTGTYYLENANNSEGESGNLTIIDVEIIGHYTWNEEGDEVVAEYIVATAGKDDEGNWVLTSGTESGVVTLKITYIDPITGEEVVTGEDESIRVDVWDSHWYLDKEKTEYDLVISDEEENAEDSAEIEYTVNKGSSVYDEDSEEWTSSVIVIDPLEIDGFTITFNDYDDSIICPVYDSETGTITVYALANGETGLFIDAEDGEGNGFEGIWVYIRVTGQLSGEITVEDEDCEITKNYDDADFNLADAMGISTNSDAALQYTILQGSDVVEIDEDGNITIIGVGTAIIKVYVDETNTYTYAKVNVTIDVDKADATISASNQTVTYGDVEKFALEATTNSDAKITYKVTSGADVVSVSSDGIVTVKQAGEAKITISVAETDLYYAATKTITVTVQEAETEETETTKTAATIAPETSTQTVTYGQSIILTAENLGLTVTGDGELIFEVTSGTDVLSIDGTTATTLKAGTAVITVTTTETDLYTAAEPVTITVTVNKAEGVASVTIGSWVSGMSAADVLTALSSTNGTGNVTYYYKLQGADDSTYTTTVPTAAGNYTLMAVFAETDCYNAVSVTYDFTIVDSETPSTDTPSTETETPSTDTPSTETETPSTETPSTETETPSTETPSTETETPSTETPSTETEAPSTESETTATESETTAIESETTATESETDTEEETYTESAAEESTESTTSSSSSSESETTDGDSVSTGDQTPVALTFAMMLLAAAILLAGAVYRKMLAGRK